MKYKPTLYFLVFWVFLYTSVTGAQAKPFTIGIIDDCQSYSSAPLLTKIKAEVKSLTKGEFDVRFPTNKHIIAKCTPKTIQAGIEKLIKDSNVNLIITLGPVGTYFLCQRKSFPKPAIGGLILSTDLQNVPINKGKSGKKNLVYVAFSTNFKHTLDILQEVTPFKKPVYLFNKDLQAMLPTGKQESAMLSQILGMKMTFIPLGEFTDTALKTIDNEFDAVFLGELKHLSDNKLEKIISYLKEHKLPGFSIYGKDLVKKGLLAGFNQSAMEKRYVRRMGLLVQRALLKDKLEDIPVAFSKDDDLIINMETAKAIGISPSFAVLSKAEVINQQADIKAARSMDLIPPGDTLRVLPPKKSALESTQTRQIDISPRVSPDKIASEQMAFMEAGITGDRLTLLDAVNLALQRNQGLKSKAKEVAAGKMDVQNALSSFYPQLGTGIGGRIIDEDRTSAISGVAERSWDITAQVTQLIYSDKANTNLKTSRHYQKALALSENQVILDVILETEIAYINVLRSRANARIQLENLKLVRSNLTLANNRYQAGFSGPSDVYRLESEAANAYTFYLDAMAMVTATKIHLHQILDLDLEKETAITDIGLNDGLFLVSNTRTRKALEVDNPDRFKLFRNFFVQKGIEQSPELQSLDEQIQAQKEVYEYAKRSYWSPDINLIGDIGNTFAKNGSGSDLNLPASLSPYFQEPNDTYWSVGLNVTLPLYEGGAKKALKLKSLETSSQLKFARSEVGNKISENIRRSLVAIGASFPAIDLTKLSAASAQKNLRLVVDNYTKGSMSIVELLDAQNASLNTKIMAENSVYDFFMDFATTERAAGQSSILMTPQEKENWVQEFLRYQ
ncbi:MAG: TolC family protein [Desulfobacteraceae bacterium]|nr:TolC family protein [Desulfobacteraceae bacterium]